MSAAGLQEIFAEAAARADQPALLTPDEQLSWGELAVRAAVVDRTLDEAGVAPGDAVALWLPNGGDWLAGFWGIVRGGRVAVPLSTFSPPLEVARLLRHARARALLTTGGFGRIDLAGLWPRLDDLPRLCTVLVAASDTLGELPPVARQWPAAAPSAVADPGRPSRSAAAVAAIQYTSGTTGTPKGALLPAVGLSRAARVHVDDWQLAPGDGLFVPNPFSHILGLTYGVVTAAAARATTLTMPLFDAEVALELVARGRAVALTGAPPHLQMLCEAQEKRGADLSSLRLAMTGGAVLGVEWTRRVRERLELASLVNGYGMSEVGSVAQTGLDDPPEVAGRCIGRPMPGLEARVVDPESGAEVAPGEVGELWLRGASVMIGYHRQPKATRAALAAGGWLRTGDLLRREPDGNLAFVGRRAEILSVGGFNVVPAEVEAVVRAHPEILEAQVVGAPDDRLGAVPVAFVRFAKEPVDDAELAAFCKERLRRYMVPKRFVVVDQLPTTATGKVDRLALRRRAEELGE